MLLNSLLTYFQNIFVKFYNNSVILQKIDWLILASIILVILTSGFMFSDNIGYFALVTILLTSIKLLTKPKEYFKLSISDFCLLIYFIAVIISVAGSSLLVLSLKGLFKTLIYLGFYISFIHFLKDNRNKLKYILLAIAIVSLGESFVALKQNFSSVAEISGWQDMSRLNPEQIMTRVYGALKPYNPNHFGGYMLGVLPTSLALIFIPIKNNHIKAALFGITTFILIACTLVMTGC